MEQSLEAVLLSVSVQDRQGPGLLSVFFTIVGAASSFIRT